jgi:hypothetical protein
MMLEPSPVVGSRMHAPEKADSPAFFLAERLLRVWSRHVQKIKDVRRSRQRLERAKSYLDAPSGNAGLGRAYLEAMARSHAKHLEELRQIRREAWELAELVDAPPAGSSPRRCRVDRAHLPGLALASS